jgi:hypothetical protein
VTRPELVDLLRRIADSVETGDTDEGSIEWLIPEDYTSDRLDVVASIRTGNLQGQGGIILIDTRKKIADD